MRKNKKNAACGLAALMVFQTIFAHGVVPTSVSAEESSTADLTNGLIGYYTFEGTLANTVEGSSGSASLHVGGKDSDWVTSETGEETYAEGKNGQAYSFTGDVGEVRGDGLELDIKMPASYTISYWVNPDTVNSATSMVFVPIDRDNGLNIADNWFGKTFPTVRIWGASATEITGGSYLDNWVAEAGELCGKWTYVTLTSDETGKTILYINGAQVAEGSSIADAFNGRDIFLGINYWDMSFDGLMDDVAIYSRALSDREVSALYTNGGVPKESVELPEPTAAPTPEPEPDEGDVDLEQGLTGYYTFDNTLKNAVGTGSAALHGGAGDTWNTPATGVVAYADGKNGQAYSFEGDTGTVNVDLVRGEGLTLDVKMSSAYTISYWVNPDTVNSATSMVFVPIDLNNGLNIADNWFGKSFPTVRIWGASATEIIDGEGFGSYLDNWVTEADTLCGQWTYITLTGNETGKNILYINGVKTAEGSSIAGAFDTMEIFLGINFWDASFDGLMDDVVVYNRALSAAEVTALYAKNGVPKEVTVEPDITETPGATETPDVTETPGVTETPEPTENPEPTTSPEPTAAPAPTAAPDDGSIELEKGLAGYYTFDNTLANAVEGGGSASLHGGAGDNTWSAPAAGTAAYVPGKNGQAYSFAGDANGVKGEGLELDIKMLSSYTISYWVNPDTVNFATSMVFVPIDTGNGLNIADNWGGTTFPTVRIWGAQAALPDCYLDNWLTEADELCGQWTYVTLTCDETGKTTLYINGAQAGTGSSIAGALSGKDIFLGINFWDASFDGLMDDVAIYDRALSGREVLALYANNGVPEAGVEAPDYVVPAHVSVHDPSIVKDEGTGMYYVFGSHRAWAKSSDLIRWETFTNNLNDKAVYDSIFANEIAWAAMGDSTYNLDGNMWAPDVIWNETLGKWCMYMSINGCSWNSCICLLTADSLDGDWTYVGPVIYSGFTADSTHDFNRTDYVEITGENTPAARYATAAYTCIGNDGKTNTAATTWNWRYGAHAIDPCIVVDEAGDWYMSYGSWSGGIYMIKLDKTTGLRDKTVTYEYKENESDPYMGRHIAGGNGVSGEASYIRKFGDYYYLYVTLGGLTAKTGYNMRVFRSADINGPYVDYSGDDARSQTADYNSSVGNRVMSGYKWSYMQKGYVAQGHNSVMEDTDGRMYLFNHYRFNDGTEGHEMRVHQIFVNEDGWLITAPFEYTGENLSAAVDAQAVEGTYEVLFHRLNIDFASLEVVAGENLTLGADGTVTGSRTGTWNFSAAKGAPYVDMNLDGVLYRGVFVQQQMEASTDMTWCFTLLGNNEISAWGYKYVGGGEELAKKAAEHLTMPQGTFISLTLPEEGINASTITWTSSNEAVLASDGTVTAPAADTQVVLTATFTVQGASVERNYPITVYAPQSTGENKVLARYFTDSKTDLTYALKGIYQYANPFYDGTTKGLVTDSGVSIKFDVEAAAGADQWLKDILSFTDDNGGKLYFEGNSYLGYNAAGGIFDANLKNGSFGTQAWQWGTDFIKSAASVELRFLPAGFEVYVNGTLAYNQDSVEPYEEGKTEYAVPGEIAVTSFMNVLDYLHDTAAYLNFGWGSWWEGGYAGTISNVVLSVLALEAEEYIATVGSRVGSMPAELAWWDYSNFYGMKGTGDFTMNWKFTNYNPGAMNWRNFAIAVTTDLERTNELPGDWYLRADAYSNSVFEGSEVTYDYDWVWDDFVSLMNRAKIDATLTREGSSMTFAAVIEGADGKTYHYTAKADNVPADDVMVYLGGENCYLVIRDASVENGGQEEPTPTPSPTPVPTSAPTSTPMPPVSVITPEPAVTPTPEPTKEPEETPTPEPTEVPEETPTPEPTKEPEPTEEVEEGPKLTASIRLYLGGDVSETYSDSRYAKVWDKDGYTVKFYSDNLDVVKVGRTKGKVTAVGVGTATITAIFTNADKETIIRTCKVTVKRNAVDAGVGPGTEEKLQNLTVGDKLQTVIYRTASDGTIVWKGRDIITDGVRFSSSDKSVFTVGRVSGKVVAVGEGEATLTVWAVQSEKAIYDEEGELVEYRRTTKPRTYKVIVTAE